jgi:hypothetical protein
VGGPRRICVFHAGIGSTHHFPLEKKDQKCPASFLPFPLPVSHAAISKVVLRLLYRALWRMKSANRGEENSAILLTTTESVFMYVLSHWKKLIRNSFVN